MVSLVCHHPSLCLPAHHGGAVLVCFARFKAQNANCGPPKRRLMRERTLRHFPEGPAYHMGGHFRGESKSKERDEN